MNAKWLVVALGVSLVLNIGAVGYLIGSASSGGSKWRGPGLDPTMGIGRMMRVLPKSGARTRWTEMGGGRSGRL